MVNYLDEVKRLKEELAKTKYNKATEHHIGLVKAKIAKLQEKQEARSSKKGKTEGYEVRKTGDGSVILVGFPSVGKSTLLNALTNADSKTAGYAFTTLTVVPGVMEYNHARIQILDVPGIVAGAASGKGRGREVLSVARSANLILIIVDVNHPEHVPILQEEVRDFGLRLNERKPDVRITKTAKDGIKVFSTVRMSKMSQETVKAILKEMRIINADIVIRENITPDQLIDVIESNKIYVPSLLVLNKADTLPRAEVERIAKRLGADLAISAEQRTNIGQLRELIFTRLDLMRVFLKEPGKPADLDIPLIIFKDATIKEVCRKLHKDFVAKFKFARVWGKSSKFPGQKLRAKHILKDGDILEIHLR